MTPRTKRIAGAPEPLDVEVAHEGVGILTRGPSIARDIRGAQLASSATTSATRVVAVALRWFL